MDDQFTAALQNIAQSLKGMEFPRFQVPQMPQIPRIEPEYTKYLKPLVEYQQALVDENKAIRAELADERKARERADRKTFWVSLICAVISGGLSFILGKII